MKLDLLPIGLYEENIYVLHDNGHVLIVDPGKYPKEIMKCIDDNEIVDGICLTHGHEDHTGAVDDLVDQYHCKVYMNMNDFILVDPKYAGSHGFDAPVYSEITPYTEDMTIGSFKLHIINTPGHTAGGVCIKYRNLLFTGDTLFAGSIGRTDLFSSNEKDMIESLRVLSQLPRDLIVLPGHGPKTTIKQELDTNMFLSYLLK